MALPIAASELQLKHSRRIEVQVYARADGLWEVDACLSDSRTHELRLLTGLRGAGEPIHDMLLRLVVDEQFNVLQAGSQMRATPYPGQCDAGEDVYARLAGLNLLKGFRQGVKTRCGATQGCTHLSELTQVIPTAVIQAFAGDVIDVLDRPDATAPPFQIDRCRALRADGQAVQTYYPRWYRAPLSSDH